MKQHTAAAIDKKVRELWREDFFYDEACTMPRVQPPEIKVSCWEDRVDITISQMYESPRFNLELLMGLANFFETMNINDDDRFADRGCETCDYGSSYGFTLTVRPERGSAQ